MEPSPGPMQGVVAAVINFNTAALTRRCVRSLLDAGLERVLVLDNASAEADLAALAEERDPRVRLVRSDTNLGFAAGSNRLIAEALADRGCEAVLLLNSDAVCDALGIAACARAMRSGGHDLMGGRLMKPAANAVDSLGITLYKSLLASNRMSVEDTYLGPTGGLALYSRNFLEDVQRAHGYVFDPSYFCYAEDTDLCVRARLLGRSVGYTDAVVGYHEGQGSTSGQYNDFILYHGIRNSIWMAAKSIPLRILLTHLPWVVFLHGGIVVRHVMQGRWRTLLRLYRDALCGLPRVLRARKVVQGTRRVTPAQFRSHIDRHFYETRYVKGALRDLFRRA